MKLLCWNINGLATTVKNIEYKYKGGLRDFFASYGADIVCLQVNGQAKHCYCRFELIRDLVKLRNQAPAAWRAGTAASFSCHRMQAAGQGFAAVGGNLHCGNSGLVTFTPHGDAEARSWH